MRSVLVKAIEEILDKYSERAENEGFSYYIKELPKENRAEFHLFWSDDKFGEFYADTKNNIVSFIHGNHEYEYNCDELKERSNIGWLKSLVEAFATGFDEFEQVI